MVENNIDLNQYIQQQSQLQEYINTDPSQVFKASLYSHIYNESVQQGLLQVDQNNQLTEQSQQFLINQVEERAKLLGDEQIAARGAQLQEHYKQQLHQLPQQMRQQQLEQYKQQIDIYNTEVDQLMEAYQKNLKNANTLVVEFSGQPEKDDFVKYSHEQLKAKEDNGAYKTPFLNRLQNDDEYLFKMLRLSYLMENGYFTDLKNAARKESFEGLGLFPKVGGGRTRSKGGSSGKVNGIELMDTADPDYQKQYK